MQKVVTMKKTLCFGHDNILLYANIKQDNQKETPETPERHQRERERERE